MIGPARAMSTHAQCGLLQTLVPKIVNGVSFLLKPEVIKMFLSPFAMWNEDTVKLGIVGHHLGHISGDEFLPLSVEWIDKWF